MNFKLLEWGGVFFGPMQAGRLARVHINLEMVKRYAQAAPVSFDQSFLSRPAGKKAIKLTIRRQRKQIGRLRR